MSDDFPRTQHIDPAKTDSGALTSRLWKNRYLIEKELGRGGFGAVYLARDQQLLSKPVVVKVLLEEASLAPYIQKKFQQEIEALARIDHPGIVGVLDVGETPEGKPFLVMQFVEGVTLRSLITAGGIKLRNAARIVIQICQALTAAHEKGVYHRDLKPENIMLQTLPDGDVQVKLIDFGIAAVKDSQVMGQTQTSMVVGTLAYMAPEQVLGRASASSDIYAVGVIAFEMVTGERPENSPTGVSKKPRELRPDLPAEIEEIILKALSYLPEDRPARPRDFSDKFAGSPEPAFVTAPLAHEASISEADSSASGLEMAHVLFMDLVGYSALPMDQQSRRIQKLQEIVKGTPEFQQASKSDQLISLPTGDGMALVFFQNPVAPVQCAARISVAIQSNSELKLRMGVHTGPVYRIADINTNRNVAGGGINIAQRVMDCGDSGHILVSKAVADVLSQLSDWSGSLHDLGEAEVKHGTKVHITNLFSKDIGNPELPVKMAAKKSTAAPARRVERAAGDVAPSRSGKGIWIGGVAVAAVVVDALVFYSGMPGKAPAPPETTVEKTSSGDSSKPPEPPPPVIISKGGGGDAKGGGGGTIRQDMTKSSPQDGGKAIPGSQPTEAPTTVAEQKKVGTVTPEPATPPQAIQPPPVPQPTAAADPPELQLLRERVIQLQSRASAVGNSMQRIEQQQSRQGLSMRSDMVASRESMLYLMDEARKALNSGNADLLKRNLGLAERQIEKLETFLGR